MMRKMRCCAMLPNESGIVHKVLCFCCANNISILEIDALKTDGEVAHVSALVQGPLEHIENFGKRWISKYEGPSFAAQDEPTLRPPTHFVRVDGFGGDEAIRTIAAALQGHDVASFWGKCFFSPDGPEYFVSEIYLSCSTRDAGSVGSMLRDAIIGANVSWDVLGPLSLQTLVRCLPLRIVSESVPGITTIFLTTDDYPGVAADLVKSAESAGVAIHRLCGIKRKSREAGFAISFAGNEAISGQFTALLKRDFSPAAPATTYRANAAAEVDRMRDSGLLIKITSANPDVPREALLYFQDLDCDLCRIQITRDPLARRNAEVLAWFEEDQKKLKKLVMAISEFCARFGADFAYHTFGSNPPPIGGTTAEAA